MLDFFIQGAWAQPAPAQSQPGGGSFLFMTVILVVLMYVLILRPQIKQAKAHRKLLESLSKGDEISTNGGLLGRIRDIGNNFVLLEVAPNVELKVQKNSITQLMPKGSLKAL